MFGIIFGIAAIGILFIILGIFLGGPSSVVYVTGRKNENAYLFGNRASAEGGRRRSKK